MGLGGKGGVEEGGIQAGAAGDGELERTIRLIKLQRPAFCVADPDVVEDAGRRSRPKSGTEGSGRSAEAHPGAGHGAWPEAREPL